MAVIYGGVRILREDGHHWRVFNITGDVATMIDMDTTKVIKAKESVARLNSLVAIGKIEICEDQKRFAAPNESRMTENQLKSYRRNCSFMEKVMNTCRGPLYADNLDDIEGDAHETFYSCAKEAGLGRKYAIQTYRRFLQSGFQKASLADQKLYATWKPANRTVKNGRPPAVAKGKILTEEDIENIKEALELLKRPGYMEIDAYNYLIDKHYSRSVGPALTAPVNALDVASSGSDMITLDEIEQNLSETRTEEFALTERPTIDQFRYIKRKLKMSEEINIARMGEANYRNNCRRKVDSPRRKLRNIGELSEVDHCELDVYVVSETDPTEGIGKPVMHAMIDSATGVIQALSVSLNNNSNDALTRLLINAFEDKVLWAERHKVHLVDMDSLDKTLFPTFIPRVIRADRGSDFKSDKFERFCKENDIDLQLVPGAMGSYKPHIERLFRSFHESIEASLVRKGFITRRYRDNSKREALLTLRELTTVCIVFALHYNQHIMSQRTITAEQNSDPEFENSPIGLFRYMLKNGDIPRTVLESQREDMVYSLLDPMTVTIHNDGLHYRGLVYDEPVDDPEITEKIHNANGAEKMEVRRDPFDTSKLWYVKNGCYKTLTQNPGRSIGFGTLSGITWEEFEQYKKLESKRKTEEQETSRLRRKEMRADIDFVASVADKPFLASDKNLKENRAKEKRRDNAEHGVIDTLTKEEKPDNAHQNSYIDESDEDEMLRKILEDPDAALDEAYKNSRI